MFGYNKQVFPLEMDFKKKKGGGRKKAIRKHCYQKVSCFALSLKKYLTSKENSSRSPSFCTFPLFHL